MSESAKEFWKIWLNPLVTVVTGLGILWGIGAQIGKPAYDNIKELHEDTRTIKQIQLDQAKHLADGIVNRAKRDEWEKQQDEKIEANRIDITKLLTKNNMK